MVADLREFVSVCSDSSLPVEKMPAAIFMQSDENMI